MNLALFDFDGTITDADCFTRFIFYAARRGRLALRSPALVPMWLGYRSGVLPVGRVRAGVVRIAYGGRDAAEFHAIGRRYARERIPGWVRPSAQARIDHHRARGDDIVVVSASLDCYLRPFCEARGLQLICSELQVHDGRITGRLVGGDCGGEEKARRVRARYDLDAYDAVYAYGDTADDAPLLSLADHPFMNGVPHVASATPRAMRC